MTPKPGKARNELFLTLQEATEQLKTIGSGASDLARKKLRKQIDSLVQDLQEIAADYDPIQRPSAVFDPTNPKIAGRLVAVTLVAQPRLKIDGAKSFYGAGVYAIYYVGEEVAYKEISKTEHPLYVGKADPANRHAKSPVEQGTKLFSRIQEHAARSIRKAASLNIADFESRHLVVATGWQQSAEEYLIHVFRPVWNKQVNVCYGIGKHGDKASTRTNRRSPWDTMHSGRSWARATAKDQRSIAEITERIEAHFKEHPPYKTKEEILLRLLEDMKQTNTR